MPTPTPESAEAIRASYRNFLRSTRITKAAQQRRLDACPGLAYTTVAVPHVVYYPARDEVEIDPVRWKLGAGASRSTIH